MNMLRGKLATIDFFKATHQKLLWLRLNLLFGFPLQALIMHLILNHVMDLLDTKLDVVVFVPFVVTTAQIFNCKDFFLKDTPTNRDRMHMTIINHHQQVHRVGDLLLPHDPRVGYLSPPRHLEDKRWCLLHGSHPSNMAGELRRTCLDSKLPACKGLGHSQGN